MIFIELQTRSSRNLLEFCRARSEQVKNFPGDSSQRHERCLGIVYNNNTSSYEDLLEIDNSVSIHIRNLQALAIELYKIVNGFSPEIMKNVFPFNT